MFVVVTLERSLQHIVVPFKWINNLNLSEHANEGVNSEETHIVFFSSDKTKNPDFKRKVHDVFQTNDDGCYLARINKYFANETDAVKFCVHQRNILPKTYSERKMKQARTHNANQISGQFDNVDEDIDEIDPNKQQIFDDIAIKMNAMNSLFIDLTPQEIATIQDIVEESDDDEDALSAILEYEDSEPEMNSSQSSVFNEVNVPNEANENNRLSETRYDCENSTLNELDEHNSTLMSNDDEDVLSAILEYEDPEPEMNRSQSSVFNEVNVPNEANENNRLSETRYDCENSTLNKLDEHNSTLKSNDSDVVSQTHNGPYPQPMDSKINLNLFELNEEEQQANQLESNTNNQQKEATFSDNDKEDTIDTLPIFSPPSTSSSALMVGQKAIPDFFRFLEPKYYDELQRKQTATQANQTAKKPHENLKKNDKSIEASAIKHTLNTINLQFPGNCVFENGLFKFPEYGVELKFGLIELIRGFTKSPENSIFFDGKFVSILLAAVIGNDKLIKNQIDNRKMNFIKEAFVKRVGSDTQRLMRFMSYVDKRKNQLK